MQSLGAVQVNRECGDRDTLEVECDRFSFARFTRQFGPTKRRLTVDMPSRISHIMSIGGTYPPGSSFPTSCRAVMPSLSSRPSKVDGSLAAPPVSSILMRRMRLVSALSAMRSPCCLDIFRPSIAA